MKKNIYCYYDKVAEIYFGVFLSNSSMDACRAASHVPPGLISKHPYDFELTYVGDIDDETGKITYSPNNPMAIANMKAVLTYGENGINGDPATVQQEEADD